MKSDKPDAVVFNSLIGKYDASLKEYPTNVGAPVIEVLNTVAWKNKNLQSVNAQLDAKFNDLKHQLTIFKSLYESNQRVYNAKFSFEPIVGNVYHLYINSNGTEFLSILAPNECNFEFIDSFRLNSDKIWEKL